MNYLKTFSCVRIQNWPIILLFRFIAPENASYIHLDRYNKTDAATCFITSIKMNVSLLSGAINPK